MPASAFKHPPTHRSKALPPSAPARQIMCKSPRVSSVSPTSASTADVPASKEVTAPSADDPSANAPVETSACRKRGAWHSRCSWAALRSVRLVRWVAAYTLSVLWWIAAVILWTLFFVSMTQVFLSAYFLLHASLSHGAESVAWSSTLHATLHATLLPPVSASEVLQELVETGATLYGGNWSGCTQKQMADLGIQENYTQGLDYVDCEVEAAFCRLRNVTSYPTWEINGQQYPECYSLQELSDKFLGDDDYYSPCAFTWEDPASIFSYSGHGTCNFEIGMFFSRALMFTLWIVMWLHILPVFAKLLPRRTFCFCVPVTFWGPAPTALLLHCTAKAVGRFAALALAASALAFAAFAASNFDTALVILYVIVIYVLLCSVIYVHKQSRYSASIDQVKTVSAA